MDTRILPFRMVRVMTAVAGTLVSTMVVAIHPASAQQASATAEPTEEIIVVAPEVVQRKTVGRSTIGAPIEVISLSRRVSYADLNLSKHQDTEELQRRIAATAKAACDQLENLYPAALYPPTPSDQNCVKNATDQAQAVASLIIAASNK